MKSIHLSLGLTLILAVTIAVAWGQPEPAAVGRFNQANLVSDMAGAHRRDARMINPWGMASLGGSDPFWINDEGTGVSELIDGRGAASTSLPLVTIPPASGKPAPSHPTGIVANTAFATSSEFTLSKGGPALFIFDTLDGTVAAWNSALKRTAVTVVDRSSTGAQYTGLAMATTSSGSNQLYAANAAGSIDVFDGTFHGVKTSGGFIDSNLPAGLTPYGIATINGNIFVAYAQRFQPTGVVDEFDPDGTLIMRFATNGTLDQPWAMVLAPSNFGAFSNDLLVGNFGNGTISAFNPSTGEFLGQIAGANGQTLVIPGLWALEFGGNAKNANPDGLYFAAGPNGEMNGIFGAITAAKPKPTPKPKKPKATPTPTPVGHRDPTPTPTPYSYPYGGYGY